ncbi:MAG: hypothetical protein JSR46_09140, partial [Verrucomicrobia bacterium]|nr:hypothetical protein [Verrucomicrobiota bacterium]
MSFSSVIKKLPDFSNYLQPSSAGDCIEKMAKEDKGKKLVDFVKAALELNQWHLNPQLTKLLEKAVKKEKAVSKKLQPELANLKKIFKTQVAIYQKEKQLAGTPGDTAIAYDLAKLYMGQKEYIPALALLQSMHQDTKKIAKKMKKCKAHVDSEVASLHTLVSKCNALLEIENFSKADTKQKILDVVKENKGLLPVEASLLRAYTLRMYLAMNPYLRGGSKLDKYLAKFPLDEEEKSAMVSAFKKAVPIMQHALTKMPSLKTLYPSDAQRPMLYRGMFVKPEFIEGLKKDHTFTNPAFTSTSTDREMAADFSMTMLKTKRTEKLLFVIKDEKGTGIPISKVAYGNSEKEILFRPNTQF